MTKSDLLSFRQCPRKLWLELHRPDLLPEPDSTSDRRAIDGIKVGEKARSVLGPDLLWPPGESDLAEAATRARQMLFAAPDTPAVEVPMLRDRLYARADALVPVSGGYVLRETKASTFPLKKDKITPDAPEPHHLDDVAIQAWVMETSGFNCVRVELNLLDSQWRYPGNDDYGGLFRQMDVTGLLTERQVQVPVWAAAARDVIAGPMPHVLTGRQCQEPYACPFVCFCKMGEPPEPEHPIELLPDSGGKALARRLKESKGYTSILQPAEEELGGKAAALYRRMQAAHRDGRAILEPGAREVLQRFGYPRYFLDFEGIDLPVPRWVGVRPYEHVPFQWSCHVEREPGVFGHAEFLDLSGADPSLPCIDRLRRVIDPEDGGPIFVYHATYERGRLMQLAERHPEHAQVLQRYVERLVDLLPLVKENFYDPRMRGSFSIKKVLPAVADDLRYDELDEVQEGMGAQVAYLKAIFARPGRERMADLDRKLRRYCRQDTWAMVEIAHFLAQDRRPTRPREEPTLPE